jgi:POT family proton-dependent oligopeptide transporter
MQTASPAVAESTGSKTLLGHPRGLFILFMTEMWERFSYYGMRSLLILYLTQHFLFSDERSAAIYGAYTALVYVMTIIGGTLADKYLGSRKAVTYGALLLVLGHIGMAFEGSGARQLMTYQGQEYQLTLDGRGGDANQIVRSASGESRIRFSDGATQMLVENPTAVGLPAAIAVDSYELRTEPDPFYQNVMYLSLSLIIAGVGFLKANISTIVGALYGFGDTRRDSGFTIFYMGINLGAFLASKLCGWLGIAYGWKYGFGLAGIGMVLGLFTFLRFQHWL